MIRQWVGSVRARVTVGAVLAVMVALLAVGYVTIRMTANTMIIDAQNAAEVQARNLAIVAEVGRIGQVLDVDAGGTTILQVVNESGEVLGASPQLSGVPALGSSIPPIGAGTAETIRVRLWTGSETDYRVVAVGSEAPGGPVAVYAGVSLTEAEHVLTELTRLILLGFAAVFVVVAAVSWLVTGWALRPVDTIRREVDKLTEQDLNRRVPVPAHQDEVHHLALTMNRMLSRLQDASQRQRDFIADASHELRSPIASLRTQLEVAAAHPEAFTVAELTEESLADTQRLEKLADDLLQLARVDAGTVAPAERIELGAALADLVGQRHGDRVPVELAAAEGLIVNMPPGVLTQVVTNLLDNAVRHADTEVTVRVDDSGGTATVTVIDDGPGIPRDERERIFQRFVRLDEARSRTSGGTGLGLSIARELVRSVGGDLRVVDSARGAALLFLVGDIVAGASLR